MCECIYCIVLTTYQKILNEPLCVCVDETCNFPQCIINSTFIHRRVAYERKGWWTSWVLLYYTEYSIILIYLPTYTHTVPFTTYTGRRIYTIYYIQTNIVLHFIITIFSLLRSTVAALVNDGYRDASSMCYGSLKNRWR